MSHHFIDIDPGVWVVEKIKVKGIQNCKKYYKILVNGEENFSNLPTQKVNKEKSGLPRNKMASCLI